DGTQWTMTGVSSGMETDAGTRYPVFIKDTNGNSIQFGYQTGEGSGDPNSSARITQIVDSRGVAYNFSYTPGIVQHLASITNNLLTGESYTFTYSSMSSLASPFDSSTYGAASSLTSLTTQGLNTAHAFAYNSSGEMTQVTTPLGGTLGWGYSSY